MDGKGGCAVLSVAEGELQVLTTKESAESRFLPTNFIDVLRTKNTKITQTRILCTCANTRYLALFYSAGLAGGWKQWGRPNAQQIEICVARPDPVFHRNAKTSLVRSVGTPRAAAEPHFSMEYELKR